MMETAAAEEFTAALEQTLSGSWRLTLLAVREGVPQALGMSVEQWQARVGGYVRLSIPDRREAARELVEDEGLTTRQAAEVLGVDQSTVVRDLRDADASPRADEPARSATPGDADASPTDEIEHGDGSIADLRYVESFLRALRSVTRVLEFDADRLADLLPSEDAHMVADLASRFTDRAKSITKKRSTLRVVGKEQP